MAQNLTTVLTSSTARVSINREAATVIIGERINPTGRKQVVAALQAGDYRSVQKDAVDQVAAGAQVLDVNAGVPGADERALMIALLDTVMGAVEAPLCIDTTDTSALSAALERYPGKALVNSVNGERHSLGTVLPLAAEHGAAVIGLCMDDDGIPDTSEGHLAIAGRILEQAGKRGIPAEDVIIDPLALTMGADSDAGRLALEAVELIAGEFGVNITLGASNISFGLPDREQINATFLAMAIHAGVTCPITNPLNARIKSAILAADLVMGRDAYGMNWIGAYRQKSRGQVGS